MWTSCLLFWLLLPQNLFLGLLVDYLLGAPSMVPVCLALSAPDNCANMSGILWTEVKHLCLDWIYTRVGQEFGKTSFSWGKVSHLLKLNFCTGKCCFQLNFHCNSWSRVKFLDKIEVHMRPILLFSFFKMFDSFESFNCILKAQLCLWITPFNLLTAAFFLLWLAVLVLLVGISLPVSPELSWCSHHFLSQF